MFLAQNMGTMNKSTLFLGHPIFGQLIKCLDKEKILEISQKHSSERYVKSISIIVFCHFFVHYACNNKKLCIFALPNVRYGLSYVFFNSPKNI